MGRSSGNVFVLFLEEGDFSHVVYRVTKGCKIQFRLSPGLHGHEINLETNHPENPTEDFCRNRYRKVKWDLDHHNEETFTNLNICSSGSFQYRFMKNGKLAGEGYFLVDPELRAGKNKELVPLDAICCQTFLSKCLGKIDHWKNCLQVAYESGYNFVHFTPIQELGASNSAYSISNQLALNPLFEAKNFSQVRKVINFMNEEWNILSLCDLVLNHTANETPWLKTNPEGVYNLENSVHLRPAYLLDAALTLLSRDIADNKYADKGLPSAVSTEEHLNVAQTIIQKEIFPKIKLEQMYLLHIDDILCRFEKYAVNLEPPIFREQARRNLNENDLVIIPGEDFKRFQSTVDLSLACELYLFKNSVNESSRDAIERAKCMLRQKLQELNDEAYRVFQSHMKAAVENIIAGVRYERIQIDGPRLPFVSVKNPFSHPYFERIGLSPLKSMEAEEALVYGNQSKFIMAHNGWVMNDDPLRNFAEKGSNVYLRRELIAWGDSVKLRYGNTPEDCPFLWNHMKAYVEQNAGAFAGIRLDNCHSTPLHVAEYMMDAARKVNPNLYVVAELFTNSDMKDNIFVNKLGITSLIREAMSAWDSHEEGRLVHRFGGKPVGAFVEESVTPLTPTVAHALLMDMTHDNPSLIEKRSIYDVIPTLALVSMASCANGSTRGLDELVPHHIHVVNEKRFYAEWAANAEENSGKVDASFGTIGLRNKINKLHQEMAAEGFDEVYVDQMEKDIVAVTRHHPVTHEKIVLVAYTAFSPPSSPRNSSTIKPVTIEGHIKEIILQAKLVTKTGSSKSFTGFQDFVPNGVFINGLLEFASQFEEHISVEKSTFVSAKENLLFFEDFQPGSIIIFRISPTKEVVSTVKELHSILNEQEISDVTRDLDLTSLNVVLYRCDAEERANSEGKRGAYNIPSFGDLIYCGLEGVNSLMCDIRVNNDLGHPLCSNLREGNWLMEYLADRLIDLESTKRLGDWLQKCFTCVGKLPRFLVPRYFDVVLRKTYLGCVETVWNQMTPFIRNGSPFIKALSLGSVQCCGICANSLLPSLTPRMSDPPSKFKLLNGQTVQNIPSLSAGLPHFSNDFMRNWGRDTFIAIPGLLISTGRYRDARAHILSYASVLRHGLIPNLLASGTHARYNCRDATWFWLFAIQNYVEKVPNGAKIFKDKVSRMWPDDFGKPDLDHSVDQTLEDVIQEALQKHFQGIKFRERNAGQQIDAHMKDEGFTVSAGVQMSTGFIYGGNGFNCGTWMDKMGSSEKAGNKGIPATPRDGCAIELTGLCASSLRFLSEQHQKKNYRFHYVERVEEGHTTKWTYSDWYKKIQENFEKYFYVPERNHDKYGSFIINESLINRRGIYKDTLGSSSEYSDYQLRPNFLVAMTVCPDLFTKSNALRALSNVDEHLLGPLGLKTLDPSDWNYNGYYDNGNDSPDMKVAHGFNYHNGPEWVWPMGFYLLASLQINKDRSGPTKMYAQRIISAHWRHMQSESKWKSLPELTNANGAVCHGSCPAQAWSLATILQVAEKLG